ncbi:hypothetical protein [Streptomyces bullii]|uniref:Uncharacterized protein n=1 Tax=Streptomyces bullii TaxID=349910 RepID=A0ABW0V061_9ACTN
MTTHPQHSPRAARRGKHAPCPKQHERAHRQDAIEALLKRGVRGMLTSPEAALLAVYWRAERCLAERSRQILGDNARALQRHPGAADDEIRCLEARMEELLAARGRDAEAGEPAA